MLQLLYGEMGVNPFNATATVWRGGVVNPLTATATVWRGGGNPFTATATLW